MDEFIKIIAIILIGIYVVVAIWVICERDSWKSSLGASLGFLAGGGIIIPIAYVAATIICYVLAGILILAIICAILGAFGS